MKRLQQESHPDQATVRHRRLRRTGADHFGTAAMILMLAVSLVFYIRLASSRFLAAKYLLLIMLGLIVLNALHLFVQLPLRRSKLGKLICGAVSLLLSAVMIWSMVGVGSVQNALARITGKMTETDVMLAAVRIDDPAQTLDDTRGYLYGYTDTVDKENTADMLAHLHEKLGDFPTQVGSSTTAVVQSLYDGETEAVIINSGFLDLLKEQDAYADFSSRARIIYEYTITRTVTIPDSDASITEPFIVYCNAIDARTDNITVKSNSDVNILAVINPSTHEILLLNTPRDYYVPLQLGSTPGKDAPLDKLTHAGAYSVETSIATLSALYDVSIPYYVRINFFGLVGIVDSLGGIDVESPTAFTTIRMGLPNEKGVLEMRSYSFPAGPVHLSGQEALAFARERKAFSGGDNQRGKNQMTVIRGIVDKITSPAILSNYQKLLQAFSDSFVTNISYDEITTLVKAQQKDMSGWHVTSYAVTGSYDSAICYSYPKYPLSVTRPDYDSVETAKELIRQVMSGETPTLPEN